MDSNSYDNKYLEIVSDILENDEFKKLRNIDHHGITRYEHSIKVSYNAYKLAKSLKLDDIAVARAGLLHDFFYSNSHKMDKERVTSLFTHPKKAVANSGKYFYLNQMEEDIIATHMFPVNLSVPKYAESWVVNLTDKTVSLNEFRKKFGYKLAYVFNLYLLFLINYMK